MKKINRYRIGYYVNFVLDILIMICAIFITYLVVCINADLKNLNEQLNTISQEIEEIRLTEPIVDLAIIEKPKEQIEEEKSEVESPKLYTNNDVIALTKMLWGEARGIKEYKSNGRCVSAKCQQAAVIWTVLNRYDAGHEDSIVKVVTAKSQFVGYRESNPVDEELMNLVTDVLDRWSREKQGETDVGRVLPADYMWFYGDGRNNHFRNDFNNKVKWDWKLADPYL